VEAQHVGRGLVSMLNDKAQLVQAVYASTKRGRTYKLRLEHERSNRQTLRRNAAKRSYECCQMHECEFARYIV
jgi:hypothetical protein